MEASGRETSEGVSVACAIQRGNLDIESWGSLWSFSLKQEEVGWGNMDLFQAWEVRSVLRGPRTAIVIQV